MASGVIWEHENFSGERLTINQDIKDLRSWSMGSGFGNWNDEISSFEVITGYMRLYEHINWAGAYITLPKGKYAQIKTHGMPDNTVSSIQISDTPFP